MIQNRCLQLQTVTIAACAILLGALGCTSDEPVSCPVCANPIVDSAAAVFVTKVYDGDTFAFQLKNDTFDVRILDIDCFETRHGDRLDTQAVKVGISPDSAKNLGLQAKALADSLLTGKEVFIVRDSAEPNLDVFGRLLRRVYMQGNRKFADTMKNRGFAVP